MPDPTQSFNDDARREFLQTLRLLTDTLLDLQIRDPEDPDCGAFTCPETGERYSRAAETVYPFAVLFKLTGETRYRDSAFLAARWLINRQREDGAWEEGGVFRGEVSGWTGTTADQLLMMAAAYPLLKGEMEPGLEAAWKRAVLRAASYLAQVMSPAFASINYVATTAAALAVTYDNLSADAALREKARMLAHEVHARMDDDGFIHGEGGRVFGIKYGVAKDLQRASELTVRTHQLNTTGKTYSEDELSMLIASKDHIVLLARLSDRFGDYGTIGVCVLEVKSKVYHLKLLLMSCRVMSRGVGTVMLIYLFNLAKKAGKRFFADFVRNERNRLMYITYKLNGFKVIKKEGQWELLEHNRTEIQSLPDHLKLISPAYPFDLSSSLNTNYHSQPL